MKHIFAAANLVVILFTPVVLSAEPVEVHLTFSPVSTLPALPVAMRVSVKNMAGATTRVVSPMTVTVTDGSGGSFLAGVSLPAIWSPELVPPGSGMSILPGNTLECIARVEGSFSENGPFLSADLPFWKPGAYQVTVTVVTADGAMVTSNAAPLTVTVPGGDDATIWQELSHGGQLAFGSVTLIERFDVIARYPQSEYYRHVAPFFLNQNDDDIDRYATNLPLAVQGLPGAYVDGARLEIALRYLDRAVSESGRNRQSSAGEWSAKGRIYAQQLIDSSASPFGSITGNGVKPKLRTSEEWQAYYDWAHTGRDGWTEPPPQELTVEAGADLPSPQGEDTAVTFTAEASGGQAPFEYEFQYRPIPDGDWVTGRPWDTTPSWTWSGAVGSFDIRALARSADQATAEATISMQWVPWPELGVLDIDPDTVTGGASAVGAIAFSSAAPRSATIEVVSSDPTVAGTPAFVTIGEGMSSQTFPIEATNVTLFGQSTITATFRNASRSATIMVRPPNASPPPALPSGDTVWIDDALPVGASLQSGANGPASWDGSQAGSGVLSLTHTTGQDVLYTSYVNDLTERIEIGETLIALTRVDPSAPPREILMRWWTNENVGCVYWGEAAIGGEADCVNQSAIAPDGWQRLEIPASQLRIENQLVTRIQLTHLGGKVWFDYIGKSGTACAAGSAPPPVIPGGDTVWINDTLPAGATFQNNGSATSVEWDASQAANGTQSIASRFVGNDYNYGFYINGLSQWVEIGENIVFYVRVNECAPPRELMIRWYNTPGGYT